MLYHDVQRKSEKIVRRCLKTLVKNPIRMTGRMTAFDRVKEDGRLSCLSHQKDSDDC